MCFLQFCWEIRTNTQTELEIVTMGVMDHYLIEGGRGCVSPFPHPLSSPAGQVSDGHGKGTKPCSDSFSEVDFKVTLKSVCF